MKQQKVFRSQQQLRQKRLRLRSLGFFSKKNYGPNPVFRLASVILTLVRKRWCDCLKPQQNRTEMLAKVSCCVGGSHLRTVWPEKALVQNPLLLSAIRGIATDCKEMNDSHIAKLSTVVWVHALGSSFSSTTGQESAPTRGQFRLSELPCSKLSSGGAIPSAQVWFQGRFSRSN